MLRLLKDEKFSWDEVKSRLIAVDTEFQTVCAFCGEDDDSLNTKSKEIQQVWCVAATTYDGRPYQLWTGEYKKGDAPDTLRRIADFFGIADPIFVCHAYALAERKAFFWLGDDPDAFLWLDSYVAYKTLLNANTFSTPSLGYAAMCAALLAVEIDTERKSRCRELCKMGMVEGSEQEIMDYCLSDTEYLLPCVEKIAASLSVARSHAIQIFCGKSENLPITTLLVGLTDAAKCFARIAERGIPISVERCEACRAGAVTVKSAETEKFISSYPDAYEPVVPSTKTLGKFFTEDEIRAIPSVPKDEATAKLKRRFAASTKSAKTQAIAERQFEKIYDASGRVWKQNRKRCLQYLKDCLVARGALERWPRSEKTGELSLSSEDLKDEFKGESGNFGADYYNFQKKITSLTGIAGQGKSDWLMNLDRDAEIMRYGSLYPFGTVTGRCAPKPKAGFVFGWWKGLYPVMQPHEGRWLVELDFSAQETYLPAYVLEDAMYKTLYAQKDIYLFYSAALGFIPKGEYMSLSTSELKKKYFNIRSRIKTFVLASQYGAGVSKLASKTGLPVSQIREIREIIRSKILVASTRWRELATAAIDARKVEGIFLPDGWWIRTKAYAGERQKSVLTALNFPIQGTGAMILRHLVKRLETLGVRTVATIHDAVLIDVAEGDYETIDRVRDEMVATVSAVCHVPESDASIRVGSPEIIKRGEIWTPEHEYDDDARNVLRAGGMQI